MGVLKGYLSVNKLHRDSASQQFFLSVFRLKSIFISLIEKKACTLENVKKRS